MFEVFGSLISAHWLYLLIALVIGIAVGWFAAADPDKA
jgi:uncharacterized membrane-anchored protein YhcB (DUF1043 family)